MKHKTQGVISLIGGMQGGRISLAGFSRTQSLKNSDTVVPSMRVRVASPSDRPLFQVPSVIFPALEVLFPTPCGLRYV